MCLGIPGQILSTDEASLPMGRVSFGGIVKDVCLAYCPQAKVGEFVIVHAGFAISIIDADEAEKTLEILTRIESSADATPVQKNQ